LNRGTIFDIKRFAIHDGPGIRTTVFFKGCPLACWWCHNPESRISTREIVFYGSRCVRCGACLDACEQCAARPAADPSPFDEETCTQCAACTEVCPSGAREAAGREQTVDEVMEEIRKDLIFFDQSDGGVTFSGGEPLMQPGFLRALLLACKAERIHTVVDTSGHVPLEIMRTIGVETDLFLYDLKLMDNEKHKTFSGVPNDLILENLRILSREGHGLLVRFPLIPGINDDKENIRSLAEFVGSLARPCPVDILPYQRLGEQKYTRLGRDYRLKGAPAPSGEVLKETREILESFGLEVRVKGEME